MGADVVAGDVCQRDNTRPVIRDSKVLPKPGLLQLITPF